VTVHYTDVASGLQSQGASDFEVFVFVAGAVIVADKVVLVFLPEGKVAIESAVLELGRRIAFDLQRFDCLAVQHGGGSLKL
jgi:hypothetical protein